MAEESTAAGAGEISAALRAGRGLFIAAAVFSAVVNLLMLTGSIFMLQVYDRVLASRSVETLAALGLIATFLYLMMGVLDQARARILTRAAARFQCRLDMRVFAATIHCPSGDQRAALALRDLEVMQKVLSSPAILAVMDVPWVPLFLGLIFIFHPLMGWLALAGGVVLTCASWLQQRLTLGAATRAFDAAHRAERTADHFRQEQEQLHALGMSGAALLHWLTLRRAALGDGVAASDIAATISAFSRAFRLFLQSAMLALGAVLTLQGHLSGGAMVSSAVLLGRALAPVEGLIAGWPMLQRAAQGRDRLAELLSVVPVPPRGMTLPRPRGHVVVKDLCLTPPLGGQLVLRLAELTLSPGQILGVVGPSGAGKSSLLRALAGVWAPVGGEIRIDGALAAHYPPALLGAAIGYLPQRASLFDGTVAENIARFSPDPNPEAVIGAARAIGSDAVIRALPAGYNTLVGPHGGTLSGGQQQRIALARALFGRPALLLLDEPDLHLDAPGLHSLVEAIRAHRSRGGVVVVTSHRQSLLHGCDTILALDGGMVRALGPRSELWPRLARHNGDQSAPFRETAA